MHGIARLGVPFKKPHIHQTESGTENLMISGAALRILQDEIRRVFTKR